MTQLDLGIEVESEHEDTYNWLETYIDKHSKLPTKKDFYTHIAKDHLKENDMYYTILIKSKL